MAANGDVRGRSKLLMTQLCGEHLACVVRLEGLTLAHTLNPGQPCGSIIRGNELLSLQTLTHTKSQSVSNCLLTTGHSQSPATTAVPHTTLSGLPAAPYLSSYLDLHLDLLSVSLLGSTPPSLFTPLRALIPLRGRPTPLSVALQGSSLRC